MKVTQRRRLVSAAALLALLLGAAACGSGDGTSQSEGRAKVRWQGYGSAFVTLPFDHAEAASYFADEKVDLSVNAPIFNSAQIIQVIAAGQADIGLASPSAAIPAIEAGRPVTTIAVTLTGFPIILALTPQATEKLAAKGITPQSSFEDRVAALKGLAITTGAAGSVIDQGFRYSLKKYGLDPSKDVTIAPQPDTAAILAATKQGAVDGFVAQPATGISEAGSTGIAKAFLDFGAEDQLLQDFPVNMVVVNTNFLKNHPDAVEGVLRALVRSQADIKNGLSDADLAAVKKADFPDTEQAAFDAGIKDAIPGMLKSIVPTEAAVQGALSLYDTTADSPTKLTASDLYDDKIAKKIEGE